MSTYPKFNLNNLHGVCGFSVFTGLVLAIQIHTGVDISEAGLATTFYNAFRSVLGPPIPYLDQIFLVVIAIINIVYTIISILRIAKHQWVGAFVSGAGFFGILSASLGSWASFQFFIIFGVFLIIAGFVVASIKD